MLSTKTALAARIDASKKCPSGDEGQKLRTGIIKRFKKI
jgi:RNA processing factor Prp31